MLLLVLMLVLVLAILVVLVLVVIVVFLKVLVAVLVLLMVLRLLVVLLLAVMFAVAPPLAGSVNIAVLTFAVGFWRSPTVVFCRIFILNKTELLAIAENALRKLV